MEIENLLEYISFRSATRYLKKNNLYDRIVGMQQERNSTGVSLIDYAVLYEYIKRNKPQYVLECGTGLSTHIIAMAMDTFCRPQYREIKLISMESESQWHKEAIRHYPDQYSDFLDIQLSPTILYNYSFVNGFVYENVPDYPYDFVFVDGPFYGDKCDMDLIKIVERSEKPVSALIDSRRTSALAYSALIGRNKIKYYPFGFGYVSNITKGDLILASKASLHHSFNDNIPKTYNMFINNIISAVLLCFLPMRLFD